MPTLIERTREVVSAQVDDFFDNDTILFYLNRAQSAIVGLGINYEKETQLTIRYLDSLRQLQTVDLSGETFESVLDYFSVEVPFPADLFDLDYVVFDWKTPVRELYGKNLSQLRWGNLAPSAVEYYFTSYDGGMEIYTDTDISQAASPQNLKIHYIKVPDSLATETESLIDLPVRVEKAIIYLAASNMVMQESVEDGNSVEVSNIFKHEYDREMQNQLY